MVAATLPAEQEGGGLASTWSAETGEGREGRLDLPQHIQTCRQDLSHPAGRKDGPGWGQQHCFPTWVLPEACTPAAHPWGPISQG